MKHRNKKPRDLRSEIEAHLRDFWDLADGDTSVETSAKGTKERFTFRADQMIDACVAAIKNVNEGHGGVPALDNGGKPMLRPPDNDEPWTAEKFVKDYELDRFLRGH